MVTPRQVLLLCLLTGLAMGPRAQSAPTTPTYGLIDLSTIEPYFSVGGASAGNSLGQAMAMADLDGDGRDDLAVTEPTAAAGTRPDAGVVVLLDHDLLRGRLDLTDTNEEIQIWGAQEGDEIGHAVVIGDFNDDGLADVAFSAPDLQRGGVARDTVFILWGNTTTQGSIIDLALGTTEMTEIVAPVMDFLGLPTSIDLGAALAVADFDSDGIDDLVIGAPLWTLGQFGEEIGQVYVLYGDSGLSDLTTFDLHATGTTFSERAIFQGYFHNVSAPPLTGAALAAGDFDGDGIDDIVVGVPGYVPFNYSNPQGRAHVIYGSTSRRSSTLYLSETSGFTTIEPRAANDYDERLGASLAMGYFNSDSRMDLLLGAPGVGIDTLYDGAAFLVLGNAARPSAVFLSNTPGATHAVFAGNSNADMLGGGVAMVDIDGDGLDDPIIGAPGDHLSDSPAAGGVIYAVRLSGILPSSFFTLNDKLSPTQAWIFGGLGADEELGRTFAHGNLNDDLVDDLLFASPLIDAGLGTGQGRAFGFPSIITRPRLIRAILVEEDEAGVTPKPGDHILLVFDRSVTVQPGPVADYDLYLSNALATLGNDATIEPSTQRSNVLVVTLGQNFSGIRVAGDNPLISTAIDLRVGPEIQITDPNTGERAVDRGIQGVEGDDPVDLIWRFGGVSDVITSLGGSLQVLQNLDIINYEYTGHRLSVPPGALGAPTTFDFTGLGTGFGPLGLTGGFGLRSSAPDPANLFQVPALLTFQYRDDDIDYEAGQIEGLVRPFQITPGGLVGLSSVGGGASTTMLSPLPPGSVTSQDAEDNTITVELNGLDPNGTGTPGAFATLPVNPVEERSIFINQSSGGGAAAAVSLATPVNSSANALLTPDTQSGYLLHTVEFPGYETTGSLQPGGYSVTIRQATIFERTTFAPQAGANMFPTQSGALFVIEVKNSSSTPVAFSAPVNVTVQFYDRTDATTTDVIDFQSKVGNAYQMRIVRSRVDTTNGPNFQFVGGTQSVDIPTGAVTVDGHTGLTDANGMASWGVVVDTSVAPPTVTLQEIIDHILGVTELQQSDVKFDLADADNDGDIDASDLVSFINN